MPETPDEKSRKPEDGDKGGTRNMGAASAPSMGASAPGEPKELTHLQKIALQRGTAQQAPLSPRGIQPRVTTRPPRNVAEEGPTDRARVVARRALATESTTPEALAEEVWQQVQALDGTHSAMKAEETEEAKAGYSSARKIAEGLMTAAEARGMKVQETDVKVFFTPEELGKGGHSGNGQG